MSTLGWVNKCLNMSDGEIIDNIIRNPLACEEAKQVARDELLIRMIGAVSKLKIMK